MMILVTGGAASGKSEFAEEITIEKGKRNFGKSNRNYGVKESIIQ